MATRYFPVSVAVPAHLDHHTDTELIGQINTAIALNTGKEPMVLVSLSPEQFVTAQPEASQKIAKASRRRGGRR